MIDHIFLDLDGVLSDFLEVFQNYTREEWVSGEFERFVSNRGFADLRKLDDADTLMSFLDSLNIPITILSSAGGFDHLYDNIVEHKFDWLETNNIPYPAVVVENKTIKANFARPVTLLIDDQEINTRAFIEAGGLAIQHMSAENTIERIKEILW